MDETKSVNLEEMLKINDVDKQTASFRANAARQEAARQEAYPELSKGQLTFESAEFPCHKEYISLSMKEDKTLIKKILDQKGSLTKHPEIPVEGTWDLPDIDCIANAVNEEFPDEKLVSKKGSDIAQQVAKYMGNNAHAVFTCRKKLTVNGTETKFNMDDLHAAVKALSVVLPARKAERIVAKEIAVMIKNVI
jgi:hypothetical protein